MAKKQKDGRYRAKVTIVPGEKPVWISARTPRELEIKKQKVRERYVDGTVLRELTFHELVIEWFDQIKKPRIKTRSTLANYQNAINLHLLPYFPAQQNARAVRRRDLQRCLDACAGMSITPCLLVRSILSNVMKYALAERIITTDPSLTLVLPAYHVSKEKRSFTEDEERRLLEAARLSPDGLMIYLLYYTGIRRGEMLGLKWGDFDWQEHLIHIQRSVDLSAQKRDETNLLYNLKTKAADRYVPIPASLESILLPQRLEDERLLFTAGCSQPLTGSEYRLRWNKLMMEAGFARLSDRYLAKAEHCRREGRSVPKPQPAYDYTVSITPHHFRHHYITACVTAGIPSEVTMRIVGHKSYQTTINIYTHLEAKTLVKACAKLTTVLQGAVCLPVAAGSASKP